ncbi:MAG: ribbon-helix-helix domain-containing protein [Candidatus Helarchaeota archaeon]
MPDNEKDNENRYVTIRIPKELVNKIEYIMKEIKLGYRNRSEFIIDAIRRRIEKFEYIIKNEPES